MMLLAFYYINLNIIFPSLHNWRFPVDRIAMKIYGFFTVLILVFLVVVTAEAVKGDKRESKLFLLKMD